MPGQAASKDGSQLYLSVKPAQIKRNNPNQVTDKIFSLRRSMSEGSGGLMHRVEYDMTRHKLFQ